MDPKRAIEIAREYVKDVYSGEAITNIGLEEVEYLPADDVWRIGISFSREKEIPIARAQVLAAMAAGTHNLLTGQGIQARKTAFEQLYKTIAVSDTSEKVLSMKSMAPPDMVA